MDFFLEDFIVGTTFDEFAQYLRTHIVSRDVYDAPPTNAELRRLFALYDLDQDGALCASEARLANERLIGAVNALRCALIVVDFQNDFVAGSLSIKYGPAQQDPIEALSPLNALLERQSRFRRVIYTMDWHPPNHISFYEHCRNADRTLSKEDCIRKLKPFDVVHFENPNFRQVLYPSHCVQSSWGAELSADLIRAENAKYVLKGSQVFVDAYSGFTDNRGEYRSELESLLKQEKIRALFICGLALDICVAATAKDAAKLGFLTAVILDCSKGLAEEQILSTRQELCNLNVAFVDSKEVQEFLDHHKVPWRWIKQLVDLGQKRQTKTRNASDTLVTKLKADTVEEARKDKLVNGMRTVRRSWSASRTDYENLDRLEYLDQEDLEEGQIRNRGREPNRIKPHYHYQEAHSHKNGTVHNVNQFVRNEGSHNLHALAMTSATPVEMLVTQPGLNQGASFTATRSKCAANGSTCKTPTSRC